eukprot:81165-Prorocentrum_lima.AAC.1
MAPRSSPPRPTAAPPPHLGPPAAHPRGSPGPNVPGGGSGNTCAPHGSGPGGWWHGHLGGHPGA